MRSVSQCRLYPIFTWQGYSPLVFCWIYTYFVFSVILENRPDESFFSRLDSSLKKNTAFVKKLVSVQTELAQYYLIKNEIRESRQKVFEVRTLILLTPQGYSVYRILLLTCFIIFLFQKNLTESQKDSLTKDFNGLNLNKYIGEAVSLLFQIC